ncbi:NADH-quinone oxidoreductase subunit C [Thermogladius sp. 4427co]|uniref:NADH-quinone oxidoreductase subunit C n=1 Tax=Thermogladius sp. 4427co TaxID=3450718 RepID=UPI003F7B0418
MEKEIGPQEFVKPNRRVYRFDPGSVRSVFEKLISERGFEGFYVSTIVGVDLKDQGLFRLDYYVVLLPEEETVVYRTYIPRDKPIIDSIVDLVPGAFSAEAEIYDLLGIEFKGNSSLRRGFFVPSDIVDKKVYPLRKD